MESSTPASTPDRADDTAEPGLAEPVAATPEPGPAEPVAVTPAPAVPPVPDLSLDETVAAEPSAPDLDAVAAQPSAAAPEGQQVSFDLWDNGSYASTLAQEGYGQSAASQPAPESAGYQQPGPTPYAQPTPSPQAAPHPQTAPYQQPAPYPQAPYGQQEPYAQANAYQQPNPYAGQNPYAPVPYGAAPSGTLTPDQERTWASAAHWTPLVAGLLTGGFLGFLGPLLVYLIQGPKSAWVKAQAAESLNFEITFIISMIASFILMLVGIGFVTVVVFPIVWLVFRIIATVATAQGRDYRYPINIRMVK